MKAIFKKRFVIAYFDSTGAVDFYHGTDINGVPQWGCYADALRMNAISAYWRIKSLGFHSGHVQALTFAQAQDAIFNQPYYEYYDDPDYIAELVANEGGVQ